MHIFIYFLYKVARFLSNSMYVYIRLHAFVKIKFLKALKTLVLR